jgi:hypothetical protein
MDYRYLVMHHMMLADRRRMEAYDKALTQVVTPGAGGPRSWRGVATPDGYGP